MKVKEERKSKGGVCIIIESFGEIGEQRMMERMTERGDETGKEGIKEGSIVVRNKEEDDRGINYDGYIFSSFYLQTNWRMTKSCCTKDIDRTFSLKCYPSLQHLF